ncbi:MAG TPA: DEAD/DEAH box helicase [Longimicrobiales bacterium]
MIVLHGLWTSDSGLCIWGEDALLPVSAGTRRRGGSAGARPRPHPFACAEPVLDGVLELIDGALEEAGISYGAAAGRGLQDTAVPVVRTLLLPSAANAPQPSPRLVREDEAPPVVPAGLAPWTVEAMALPAHSALELLLAASDRGFVVDEGLSVRILLEESIRYWGDVARHAVELAARGRLVPAIERDGAAFLAVWRPAPTDRDADWRDHLARRMPAVCRADRTDRRAGRTARDLVDLALATLVDACARDALADHPDVLRRGDRSAFDRLPAQAWIPTLAAPTSRINGAGAADLAPVAAALDAWARPATRGSHALRTCFRLSAPEATTASNGAAAPPEPARAWRLEFLLQATDDPSLVVPAADVWKSEGRTLRVLQRRLDDPQERLLEDLGRALRLVPALEPALRTATPTGLELDTATAHRFLTEGLPLLEAAGFGVLVPAWWRKPRARLGLRLRARPSGDPAAATSSSGHLGLDALCDYEWRLALGDEALTADELRRLARLKQPLIRLRGQWIELRPEEVEAALAILEGREDGARLTAAEALRVGLGVDPAPGGLPVLELETDGWLHELLDAADDECIRPAAAPAGFNGKLRPYQARGLGWLVFLDRLGLGACLADDMGLGKTIQLLALLLAEREEPAADLAPTLLVCPMSVVGNWQREAARFAPTLRVHVHHGAERPSGKAFERAVRSADLVITTYALAARDRDELAAIEWGRVVLDEAQNIKNPAAKQTRAVRSLTAPRRIALTGTPVENRLTELWSIMEFLNPGLLGGATEFRTRFSTPIERYRDDARAEQLKRLTAPFILRRLKTDRRIISDLPEKIEIKVFCNLTREQATLYQAVVDEMLEKIETSEGIERKGLVLSTILKLKQVCNHPAQLLQDRSALEGRSGKLARLEETLDEALAAGDRVLVFTQFAEMGRMLRTHLQHRFARDVLFLHGGTSKKARDEMIARFQAETGPGIFVLSLKAGGTGLNLTAANHVVHFDRWWNPAVEDQATDRAFRIGQRRDVQVRKFVCAGTIEERIDAMIEEKKALAERIVGSGEAWLTELSTAELRALVALARDAVAE